VRGECAIVVEGPPSRAARVDADQLDERIRTALRAGATPGRAAREIAAELGAARSRIYARALQLAGK
jgi:16S rRNA C1402 (ribose-2'-O) methylase RsmI